MASGGQGNSERASGWAFAWVGVLFPLICVGPLAGLALLSAALSPKFGDIWYFLSFLVVPAGVLSAIISVLFSVNVSTDAESRVALVAVAVVGNALAVAVAVTAMAQAMHIACDPYDCF